MIFALWVVLLVLSLLLIGIGYYTDLEPFSLVGLSSLFLLSFVLLLGNVTYQDCEYFVNYSDATHVYGDNYSGYHWDYVSDPPSCSPANPLDCVNLFHIRTEYDYREYCVTYTLDEVGDAPITKRPTFYVGLFLAIVSGFGFGLTLFNMGERRRNGQYEL